MKTLLFPTFHIARATLVATSGVAEAPAEIPKLK
jgi:hypothetical protein